MSSPKSSDNKPEIAHDPRHYPGRQKPENSEPAPDADLEERVMSYWEKNGKQTVILVLAVMAFVVGVQLYRYISSQNEEALNEEFASLSSLQELQAFAAEHSSHTLGGIAKLEAAHTLYEQGNYAEAAESYQSARESLQNPQLFERARFGEGMALLMGENTELGIQTLQSIFDDLTLSGYTRGEAAYNIALQYLSDQNYKAAQDVIDRLVATPEADIWIQLGNALYAEISEE